MRNEKGFTLIELLVVVAIVGILAAIAIPQFAEYRTRAFNSNAVSDLRNSITAQEAAFVDAQEYATCADPGACETALPGFKASQVAAGDAMDVFAHTNGATGDSASFNASSSHTQGTLQYNYVSEDGTLVSIDKP
jgi:prepilin-type N-terminal cleavage/methylation domain-containing protein